MADALAKDMVDSAGTPSDVARQKFDLERRGYDQAQVRAYLIAVADALRDAQTREAEIRTRLGKAIRRAEKAEADRRETPPRDAAELSRQVGDEVAAVLDAARVAGEQKIAAAEKSAEQLMANAKSEATQIRKSAETILDERRAEADAEAERILADRRAEADKLVATATSDAETLRSDAAADVVRVREECDALVREAEEARLQILQDMDRRRRQARAQVERLRVGRDRLLRSYEVVRRNLDESTLELKSSLKEAKVLGDTAARTAMAEPLREPVQLEAEMADSRLIGRTPPATPAKETPAAKRSEASDVQVPSVDMRPGAFTEETAPTPRRPVVGQTSVPKPPAVAPTIKAPDAPASGAAAPVEPVTGGSRRGDASAASTDAVSVASPASPTMSISGAEAAEVDDAATGTETEGLPELRIPGSDLAAAPAAVAVLPVPRIEAAGDEAGTVDQADDAASSEPAPAEDPVMRTASPAADADTTPQIEADEPDLGAVDIAAPLGTDEDFSDLPKEELAVIVASDEIEQVVAVMPDPASDDEADPQWIPVEAASVADPTEAADATSDEASTDEPHIDAPAQGLFAALRRQAGDDTEAAAPAEVSPSPAFATADSPVAESDAAVGEAPTGEDTAPAADVAAVAVDASARSDDPTPVTPTFGEPADMARQRDAVIAELAKDLEKRLKRALADEQNDVLAGLRAAGKRQVDLISLVGETDDHVQRYVVAINEVAADAYGAGAALVEGEAAAGVMPAGAVEELIGSAIVLPIRLRLIELDSIDVERAVAHLDAIRAFYRQRKTDHLGEAASSLAALLVTSGACDALPADTALPWLLGV